MTSINPLNDIAFEDINDEYCYGKYGDFDVIMMKNNGYINATNLCDYIVEQTGSKKTYKHWNDNKNKKIDWNNASIKYLQLLNLIKNYKPKKDIYDNMILKRLYANYSSFL